MKNTLSSITDTELLTATKSLAKKERALTLQVLHYLREVEKRLLYARRGFQNLYEYAVKELGYSEGAAHRRIASMRLLKEIPELESKVESGTLPLSTLAQAHSFFRTEKIKQPQIKREVLLALENKSQREVQRNLLSRSTQAEKHFREALTPYSESHHKMSILLDEYMLNDLEELRSLLSSSHSHLSLQEVIQYALKKALEIKRPKAPKLQKVPRPLISTPTSESKKRLLSSKEYRHRSRYIPINIRRQVWSRDQGCCNFRDEITGKLCATKYGLQLDHIHDFASGGTHTVENLRLRCRAHNTLAAVERFGSRKMSRYVPSLQ